MSVFGETDAPASTNIKSACGFVKDMTVAMETVANGAKDIQVDGDQIAIDGYKNNGVSSDTT